MLLTSDFGYLNGRPIWKLNLKELLYCRFEKEIAEQGGTMKLSNRVLKWKKV